MANLNKLPEQNNNPENNESSIIKKTKKDISKLFSAVVISLSLINSPVNAWETITSYNQLQKITSKMKEQDTITVRVKSWNIDNFIKKLEDKGFEVKKWKNWKLIITKKQKKEEKKEEDLLAAWGDFEKDMETYDKVSQKELAESQKELAESQKEKEFAKTLLDTLRWIQKGSLNKQEVVENLEKMKKDVYAWNIVSSEYNRKTRLDGLDTIKTIYKKNKKIVSIIKKIKEKLNPDKIK